MTRQTDRHSSLLGDGIHSYTYDAEGRILQVDGGGTATYGYDAEGERVTAVTAAGESEFLRDLNGQQVTWILNGVYQHTNIYAGSELIATWNGAMFYHYRDWLGSSRVQTDSAAYATAVCTNLPYGETSCAGTNVTQQGFTGWEYDPETGLHYAHARYYNSRLGRFMTVDPLDGDIRNPQSLNRYAYVGGDPINFRDSNGMLGSDFGSAISGLPSGGLSTLVLGFVDFLGDLFGFGDDGPPFTGTLNPRPTVPKNVGGDFPNGESLGIPTGMKLPQLSIWQTIGLVPIDKWCDYGPCVFGEVTGTAPVGDTGYTIYDEARAGGLNDRALTIFTQVGQTAGQLTNPCTIGLFYAGSALLGAGGGTWAGVRTGGAVFPEMADAYSQAGYSISQGVLWARRLQPLQRKIAGAVAGAAQYVGAKAQAACDAMANW